jgi:protein-S-isoprenylcysteine O-methyltransferase Ste14
MKFKPFMFTIIPPLIIVYIGTHPPARWSGATMTGLILAVFGFAMLTIARIQLGNSFSITPQAKELVTSGIYSRVRHPVYLFSAIGLAGASLYFNKPAWLVGLLLLVPVQIVRARAEERVLEARFGQAYRTYKQSTWL